MNSEYYFHEAINTLRTCLNTTELDPTISEHLWKWYEYTNFLEKKKNSLVELNSALKSSIQELESDFDDVERQYGNGKRG